MSELNGWGPGHTTPQVGTAIMQLPHLWLPGPPHGALARPPWLRRWGRGMGRDTASLRQIFNIFHLPLYKKKKKKCEFDPQVIPLSTCLFVTAGGFTLPITAWCHSLSRVRIKLSWTWGLLFLQSCVSSCSLDLSHLCITWFSDGWFCIFADLSCTCIVPVRFPSLWKASD